MLLKSALIAALGRHVRAGLAPASVGAAARGEALHCFRRLCARCADRGALRSGGCVFWSAGSVCVTVTPFGQSRRSLAMGPMPRGARQLGGALQNDPVLPLSIAA